jgi:hypothetical protein
MNGVRGFPASDALVFAVLMMADETVFVGATAK